MFSTASHIWKCNLKMSVGTNLLCTSSGLGKKLKKRKKNIYYTQSSGWKCSNIEQFNLLHSDPAHVCIACQHLLEEISILQVYLGNISLCMGVMACQVSLLDLLLTECIGRWLQKTSCQKMQKRKKKNTQQKVNANRVCSSWGADCIKMSLSRVIAKSKTYEGNVYNTITAQDVCRNTCVVTNTVYIVQMGDATKDA